MNMTLHDDMQRDIGVEVKFHPYLAVIVETWRENNSTVSPHIILLIAVAVERK